VSADSGIDTEARTTHERCPACGAHVDERSVICSSCGLTLELVPGREGDLVPPDPQNEHVSLTCTKCGSSEMMPKVRIMDRGHYGSDSGDLTAVTYDDPDALILKGAHRGPLFARICGTCGFTELYLDNYRELYEAYRRANAP
jgi:ribosomal protein S27AE